jgi:hypothetical protein
VASTSYRVRRKDGAGELVGVVVAESYNLAAQGALKLLFPNRVGKPLVAVRVTGDHNKSGCFRAYVQQGDGLNSYGEQFHIA